MLNNSLFDSKNKDTYPPFKNGLYLEEYFFRKISEENPQFKRKYIPVKWTNFQIEGLFESRKNEMQLILDDWIKNNPSEYGYFTIVQFDDGCLLKLPENTIVYGACSGNIPIPLIYEDKNNTLENISKKQFNHKQILCSFIGNITYNCVRPNVRQEMFNILGNNPNFKLINSGGGSPDVNKTLQNIFIETTINSKFALAPRGYGRSSFRLYEAIQLGSIPVFIYDHKWLPFEDEIDWNEFSVLIDVNNIQNIDTILSGYTPDRIKQMQDNLYNYWVDNFTMESICKKIINRI